MFVPINQPNVFLFKCERQKMPLKLTAPQSETIKPITILRRHLVRTLSASFIVSYSSSSPICIVSRRSQLLIYTKGQCFCSNSHLKSPKILLARQLFLARVQLNVKVSSQQDHFWNSTAHSIWYQITSSTARTYIHRCRGRYRRLFKHAAIGCGKFQV